MPRVYLRVCITRYMPRYTSGCVYNPVYASLCTMVGIHRVYASLLYHPGYTSRTYRTSRLPVIAVPGILLRREEALGSERGISLGESLSGP